MKIIDLLNKIANDEEVPKKIIYNTRIFTYNEHNKCYIWNCNGDEFYLSTYYRIEQILNDEVEIIDEEKQEDDFTGVKWLRNGEVIFSIKSDKSDPKEKEIEKLDVYVNWLENQHHIKVANKINEIIEAVNEIKRGNNDK